MPQQSIGSTARTLSSTDMDRNTWQTGCPQLVASYDTQEDTLDLFYYPGHTGGCSYRTLATTNKFGILVSYLQWQHWFISFYTVVFLAILDHPCL